MILWWILLYFFPGVLWYLAAKEFVRRTGNKNAELGFVFTAIIWPVLLLYRILKAREIGRYLKPHSRARLIFFMDVKIKE